MSIYLEYLINGLQAGLLLFVVSAGLTISFGLMRIVNLSHGSLYMVGAFLGITTATQTGSFVLGAATALLGTALVGFIIERSLFSRLYPRGAFAQVLVSFGLIFVFDELVRITWGADVRSLPRPGGLDISYDFLGAKIEAYRLFLILLGAGLSTGLIVGLIRTPLGVAIRAAVDDREAAELLGLNVKKLFTVVFCLGTALAGLAGYVAIPLANAFPGMGDSVLISALVVVAMGGVGSILGSLISSLLIGFALTAGQVYMAGYSTAAMYILLALVLFVRPLGLFGKPE